MARFLGDDPGQPRFDRGLTGLTRLIRSLVLMTVIKNLGRHRSVDSRFGVPLRSQVGRLCIGS
jgi:hypothetical protein